MNWILALASAVLLAALFPGYSFSWLAPIALTPLLIACAREPRWRVRFAFGYLCGIVYWAGLCHWIQWTLVHHGGMGGACLGGVCGFLLGQGGADGRVRGAGRPLAAAVPCAALWVVLEWTHAYTGFAWLQLGNAGSDMSLLLRLAPFTGVWGLSFAFALMSAVIAAVDPAPAAPGQRLAACAALSFAAA